ncbi:CoxG family protein [Nocardioides acrostichi]|uniref:SRPBCC family protein n=1 Tax=Nocardioides acrostichi TaxID=2784339 RepID=A0A930Y9E1_9ACTN|nr:SRPBCC family protein [Nocardioides acrostichi]MBF4160268.1 SRPBCC family protein [Nocardioides acrostichi]
MTSVYTWAVLLRTFTSRLESEAEVAHACERVFAVVSDPDFISRSTPFIRRVTDLGDGRWRWHVVDIPTPQGSFGAVLTQRTELDPPQRVRFRHEPQGAELAGADGTFTLTPVAAPDGPRTRLRIDMTVRARVPAPRVTAPVVEQAMRGVLALMRQRFVAALTEELAD